MQTAVCIFWKMLLPSTDADTEPENDDLGCLELCLSY
jgi:hypothetical protein